MSSSDFLFPPGDVNRLELWVAAKALGYRTSSILLSEVEVSLDRFLRSELKEEDVNELLAPCGDIAKRIFVEEARSRSRAKDRRGLSETIRNRSQQFETLYAAALEVRRVLMDEGPEGVLTRWFSRELEKIRQLDALQRETRKAQETIRRMERLSAKAEDLRGVLQELASVTGNGELISLRDQLDRALADVRLAIDRLRDQASRVQRDVYHRHWRSVSRARRLVRLVRAALEILKDHYKSEKTQQGGVQYEANSVSVRGIDLHSAATA